jgi:hypothetical protein
MYQALQWKHVISILGGIVVVIYVGLSWWSSSSSAFESVKNASAAISWSAAFVWLVGNKWVFPWLWRWWPIQAALFPYIAGKWTGEVKFNWPVIEAMRKAFIEGAAPHPASELHVDHIGYGTKGIKVAIEADLFHLRMVLTTDDGYSTSQSIMVGPDPRGSLTGGPRLLYFYDNQTPEEKVTDSSQHYGRRTSTSRRSGPTSSWKAPTGQRASGARDRIQRESSSCAGQRDRAFVAGRPARACPSRRREWNLEKALIFTRRRRPSAP